MKNPDYNEVQMSEVKPTRMWPEWMTQRIRGLWFVEPVACACCGKKKKHHWTMLMSFQACIFGKSQFTLEPEPKVHLPLTPVCSDHPLNPMMPTLKKAADKTVEEKAKRKRKFYGQGD